MLIDTELLNSVSDKAKKSNRLRMNYNFHTSLDAKSQRLLNALEIGTILPIHRHTHTSETYIVLRGSIKVFYYNKNKEVISEYIINPLKGVYGINIEIGQWHTLEVLESNTVIFEVKDGPYMPLTEKDMLK